MFSELGLIKDFDIFGKFNIKISGHTPEGKIKTMPVKAMEISLRNKALYLLCEDEGKETEYSVDLDESIAQFVAQFWE